MLERIHSTFYWTADMDRAVSFYRDVLGLDLRARVGDDWAEFAVGGTTVAIHGSRGAPHPTGATVVFQVADLDRAVRALRDRGADVEGDITEVPGSGGRFVSVRDPAGNVVQLFEPPTGGGPH